MGAKYKGLKVVNIPITFRKRADKSRLISNIFSYAFKTLTIVSATILFYKSFKFFGVLSAILFAMGAGFSVFILDHYFTTGTVEPHHPTAMLAILFLVVASVSTLMAIISSILGRQSLLLEEILYLMKDNKLTNSKDN